MENLRKVIITTLWYLVTIGVIVGIGSFIAGHFLLMYLMDTPVDRAILVLAFLISIIIPYQAYHNWPLFD